jgi:two-component system sensor histidine kinase UhpB
VRLASSAIADVHRDFEAEANFSSGWGFPFHVVLPIGLEGVIRADAGPRTEASIRYRLQFRSRPPPEASVLPGFRAHEFLESDAATQHQGPIVRARPRWPNIGAVSLRLQINLIIAGMIAIFTVLLVWQRVEDTRRSVREEVEAASIVASQVLTRVGFIYEQAGLPGMLEFMVRLGHVRSNDISLYDSVGRLLYRSPAATYKAGREAPPWFSKLVTPPLYANEIALSGGRMVLRADASRAVLDGWDDLVQLLGSAAVGLVAANALVYLLAGRALRPLGQVVEGLRRVARGEYETRLPAFAGREARSIAEAFNTMTQVVQESEAARQAAAEAKASLAQSRELTQIIQSRIELERAAIARELHDELGQQVTAIKSAGLSIAQRVDGKDAALEQAARLVVETAGEIYGVVHQIIARMRPLALDGFGLGDALGDLIADWRLQHPRVEFGLRADRLPADLGETLTTAAYRIVQEAVNNALNHGRPTRVDIELRAPAADLEIRVADNGRGLPDDWSRPGHFGVIGMRERAVALGGSFELLPLGGNSGAGGGVEVRAQIPLQARR